eukprot:CAMPEP_0197241854 /NCGR_PEP_ID=MMETSP1429-20130617/7773_1 /TAXON_ID=49237 /ORGANISM="Chaetoceros  sp., Strain UNC1202" /LENGTH=252 /DNA_ID=CAMNT_0042701763 /DNA_START=18 /DNA_END=773 /DNA_ORIENTATION=-
MTREAINPNDTCHELRRSIFYQFWMKQMVERKRAVRFDPHVSVREYNMEPDATRTSADDAAGSKVSPDDKKEVAAAKLEVLSLLRRCAPLNPQRLNGRFSLSRFSSPAFKVTHDDSIVVDDSADFTSLLVRSIRNILIVDAHMVFLDLHLRCIKAIMPHVTVSTANCGPSAIELLSNCDYDIVIVDQRIRGAKEESKECRVDGDSQFTGSDVLRHAEGMNTYEQRRPLLIGTSLALKEDCGLLSRCGVDYIW